ncbi:MAG: cytochrome c oxidase accessory protein CcoG [Bdellovibrionales bacterium]
MATLDEFGGRKFVVPAEVKGPFRTLRNRVNAVLLFIFLAMPWIKINGLQALLLDIPHRHFEIFGRLFLAHDAPLIFLILGFLALILAFVTAVWGRVWCGWACPQTVFIDGLYRKIEIWAEGDYLARRKLRSADLSFQKMRKVTLKWVLFFAVSSAIAHSFIAYFTGSDQLLQMMRGSPSENWTYFLIISAVTALLMFNFGWFREQFCLVMCPYGRFQSVLMDAESVTVAYDEKRGEPRKGLAAAGAKSGDCVSCNRCVQVCPTGIDIRKGIQMECIACTACIDACNEIMSKVHKAPDLIAYRSMSGSTYRIARPRALILLGLAIACGLALVLALAQRSAYAVNLLRASDSPYQVLPEGKVLNHFKLHIMNQSQNQEEFEIQLPAELAAQGITLTQNSPTTVVNSGESSEAHFFLIFPRKILTPLGDLQFEITFTEQRSHSIGKKSVTVVGPQN